MQDKTEQRLGTSTQPPLRRALPQQASTPIAQAVPWLHPWR